jgi:hypothetical protein
MRDLSIKNKDIYCDGILIATGYTRVVHGGRGQYLEIPIECAEQDYFEVVPGQEYRLTEKWKHIAYYAWYRVKESLEKVYFQYKKVNYADYLPGYYYVSVKNLTYEGELYTEKSDKPLD